MKRKKNLNRTYKKWTPEEERWLIEHFPHASEYEIIAKLDRKFSACRRRVQVLRERGVAIPIRTVKRRLWTDREENTLRKLWEWSTWEELKIALPNRSYIQVKGRVQYLRDRKGIKIPSRKVHSNHVFTSPIDGERMSVCIHHGYWTTRRNGKLIPIHRIEMGKILGRPLESGELIHHKDGDPANNHPDNLFVVYRTTHRSINAQLLKLAEEFIKSKGLEEEWRKYHES